MTDSPLTAPELDALRALDTPTVCNALELVVPARRGAGYTSAALWCAHPRLAPMVGYARTATVRARSAPSAGPDALRETRLRYYAHVAEGPGPTVVVIQDLDPEPGYGAFWGEVNTNVHKGLGCLGVVTNGSVRDLDDCAAGFQMLAGKVGPSHAFVHVVECGVAVEVAGMAVRPGDLIHADQHGAVVVPPEAAREVPAAAALIARREGVIIAAAQRPDFGFDALADALRRSADIH